MKSGQISQCHLIQVENDSNHWARISSQLPPLISAQLKATLTLRLFFPHHFRGFTLACVQYLNPFQLLISAFLLFFCIYLYFLRSLSSYLTHLLLCTTSSLPLCLSLSLSLSFPSHVEVLVYWTGLKLSVSWSVTLCWICSARLSSH